MPLQPGTTLGPYEILSPIGAGGMGEVYKARDTRLDRTVAIKVLPENVAADPDLKQRFEREAKTISSLNHPHICTLHDIGSQDGIDFLVMEYLEGDTLGQRLQKGAMPLDQALQVAIQIADALDKAHRQGITHQDLKPEAKTISSLNHPHICTLHDIGSQDGIDFLVMEYLEGDTLGQRLQKGAMPLDQALQVAIQIADALDKAHRQGITHQDLKPGNITPGAAAGTAAPPPRETAALRQIAESAQALLQAGKTDETWEFFLSALAC